MAFDVVLESQEGVRSTHAMTAEEAQPSDGGVVGSGGGAATSSNVSNFDPVVHDLTHTLSRYLDRHLVFPLLEFLQSRDLYDEAEILEGKIVLLKKTNMVDFAMEIYMVRLEGAGRRAVWDQRSDLSM